MTLICETVTSIRTPAEILWALRDEPGLVGLLGSWFGGCSVIGIRPAETRHGSTAQGLVELFDETHQTQTDSPVGVEDGRLFGGWIGYSAFDEPEGGLPLWQMALYDAVAVYHPGNRWSLQANSTPENEEAIDQSFEAFRAALTGQAPRLPQLGEATFRPHPTPEHHKHAVAETVRRIHSGILDQANICMTLRATCMSDPLSSFVTGFDKLQAPYSAYLDLGRNSAVSSFSPELFYSRDQQHLVSRPIKGTRPRLGDPQQDQAAADDLLASAKEQDENLLVTREAIAELEPLATSLSNADAPSLEAHPGVWHLVSTISAELKDKISDAEVFDKAFPPASIAGVPRSAAMAVIHELEAAPRGIYTGAIGMLSVADASEWSVAIRTFVHNDGEVTLGVGGGITAGSDPEAEVAECYQKAAPLIDALGATLMWEQ